MRIKKWRLPQTEENKTAQLSQALQIPRVMGEILSSRGHRDPQEVERFLRGQDELHDAYLLKDMDKAVERISQAVENGEYIAVYGDYDCDGITSTALLYTYFQDIGARVLYYIPDRDSEGYGLNVEALDALKRIGVELIVTVDNGISAIDEVEYARTLGIDVVITDHHQPREILPNAAAVVDPHRTDCPYPFKHLCGVGVAFKLVCAMEGDTQGMEMLDHFSSLVTLGTVADVVELVGENRTIVKTGLQSFEECASCGMQALMECAGLSGKRLDSGSLAFGIVPRLNASGRIGKAELAVELLLCDDPQQGAELAQQINEYNDRRKDMVNTILADIDCRLQKDPTLLEERLLILWGENWHHGVIGIAAAKMVERYSKPCLLISIEGDECRGSARSVQGYSIIGAISRCHEHLTRYGGHEQAAGFSLLRAQIEPFARKILDDAAEHCDIMPVDELPVDAIASVEELTLPTVEALSALEPFGCANEAPVVLIPNCTLEGIHPLSGDKHIQLRLRSGDTPFTAVYFGVSSREFPHFPGDRLDLAASLGVNCYNGETSVSVKIKSVHPCNLKQEKLTVGQQYYEKLCRHEPLSQKIRDYITPSREDVAVLYRYLKQVGSYPFGYDQLWCRIGGKLNYCKMRVCLDVMEELSLLERQNRFAPVLTLKSGAGKTDLERSEILKNLKGGDVCAYIR